MNLHLGELLSTKQAAQLLGLKPNTLAKWRVAGTGPVFVTMGRAVRYRVSDLRNFIDCNRRVSTSPYRASGQTG